MVSLSRCFQAPSPMPSTTVGQLAMMRRLAGCKIPGENYYVARIRAGQTGADQPKPVKTF